MVGLTYKIFFLILWVYMKEIDYIAWLSNILNILLFDLRYPNFPTEVPTVVQ